jgi:hypothetical protein
MAMSCTVAPMRHWYRRDGYMYARESTAGQVHIGKYTSETLPLRLQKQETKKRERISLLIPVHVIVLNGVEWGREAPCIIALYYPE